MPAEDTPAELSFMRPLTPKAEDAAQAPADAADADAEPEADKPKLSRAERRGKATKANSYGKVSNMRFPPPPAQRNFSNRRSGG